MASAVKQAELARRGLGLTPPGQVSFPKLFGKPSEFQGKYTWNLHLVFHDPTVLGPLKDFVKFIVEREGAGGKIKVVDKDGKVLPNFRWPWRPNAEKVYSEGDRAGDVREGFESGGEHIVFKKHAKTEDDEATFDRVNIAGQPLRPADVYAGCQGVVCFRPFLYKKGSNVGVSLSLEAFQKTGEGEPIGSGGKVDSSSVFDFVEVGDEISVDDV